MQEHLAQTSTRRSLDGYRPRGAGIYRDGDQLLIISGITPVAGTARQKTSITSPLYKEYILELNPAFQLIPHLNDVLSEAAALTGEEARAIWNEELVKI